MGNKGDKDGKPQADEGVQSVHPPEKPQRRYLNLSKLKKTSTKWTFAKIIFSLLCVILILCAIVSMAFTVSGAVTARHFTEGHSGRQVGLIVLTVTAAVAIGAAVYAIVSVIKRQNKTLAAVSSVLILVAVIQVAILATGGLDENELRKSLIESFRLYVHKNHPWHTFLWRAAQHNVKCCGVYGPADYIDIIQNDQPAIRPPNVPISCCPSFNPFKPDSAQEKQRYQCKAFGEYYSTGCNVPLTKMLKAVAGVVVVVNIVLVLLELTIGVSGSVLSKIKKQKEPNAEAPNNEHEQKDKEKQKEVKEPKEKADKEKKPSKA